ncbi:hypothetical protein AC249_AIPGENE7863 [Exaiptasia diaphana]|nr:hypothetical protein AC249_AIPGENE7863 [Exaiptasia diaphana]
MTTFPQESSLKVQSKKRKNKKKRTKRVKSPKTKNKLAKLMDEASSMMRVATKAAKTHRKFLKAFAAEKNVTVSSSSQSE